MMLSSVDLPQPLGPTRQTNSPSLILSEMSSSACTAPRPVRNTFETCSTASFEGAMTCNSSTRGMGWCEQPPGRRVPLLAFYG